MTDHGIVLHQPAFTGYRLELGEITSYPPGYKENAGIFCHNNTWIHLGWCALGDGDRALEYYHSICPSAQSDIETYRAEPYVYAQMIAGRDAATPGEAKNSWLTGTAAWTFVTLAEGILGIKPTHDGLADRPVHLVCLGRLQRDSPVPWDDVRDQRVESRRCLHRCSLAHGRRAQGRRQRDPARRERYRRTRRGRARRGASLTEPDMGRLEAVARRAASRFEVPLGQAYAMSNYSFVAPAGDDAVVKVRWEEDEDSNEEAEALRLWNGNGAVRLLDEDPSERALLLERALPGTDLSVLPEDEALAIAIDVARRLWVAADTPFRWLGDHISPWLDRAERVGGPDHELVPLARELYASLDVGRSVLVHGDFHHHNILQSARGHLSIDPKPMLGEPEYDIPSFLWNPLGSEFRLDVAERRIAAFEAAGLDGNRIRKWAVIRGAYLGHGGGDALVLRALLDR